MVLVNLFQKNNRYNLSTLKKKQDGKSRPVLQSQLSDYVELEDLLERSEDSEERSEDSEERSEDSEDSEEPD